MDQFQDEYTYISLPSHVNRRHCKAELKNISIPLQSCRRTNKKPLCVSGREKQRASISYLPILSYWTTTSSMPPSLVLTCTGRRNFLATSSLSCSNTQSRSVYTNTHQNPHRHERHLPLLQIPSLKARFATDHVTFAYLTDVYINTDHRAGGLGSWLIECCREWMDGLPFLRRSMLMASEDFGKAYYAKAFGMEDVAGMGHGLVCMSKTGPGSPLDSANVKH
jgi:hypothetical protein